jgi:hypothetical protein
MDDIDRYMKTTGVSTENTSIIHQLLTKMKFVALRKDNFSTDFT